MADIAPVSFDMRSSKNVVYNLVSHLQKTTKQEQALRPNFIDE